jgi:hypothetical protein
MPIVPVLTTVTRPASVLAFPEAQHGSRHYARILKAYLAQQLELDFHSPQA